MPARNLNAANAPKSTAAKLAADLQNPQMPVGAVPLRFKISRMSLCCFITTTFFYAVWAAFALLPFPWAIFQRGGIQTRFQDKKISRNLYIAADLFV